MNNVFLYGLGEKQSDYKSLSKHFYIPKIDWNAVKIEKMPKKIDILVGFSLGACLAFQYATKHPVGTLILCSLPPGIETLKNVEADRIVLIAGEKEEWVIQDMKRLYKTTRQEISDMIFIVKDCGHRITGDYRKLLIDVKKYW